MVLNERKSIILMLFLMSILINSLIVYSEIEQDHVIVNSKDWRDVYSSILFSKIDGKKASFIQSPSYASIILNSIPKENKILAISSKDQPYVKGYKAILDTKDYDNEELVLDNVNFELANLIDDKITKFIIIDDVYGYNAISVASYAILTKSYVLFVNDVNIDRIVDYLQSRTVDSLIIYGQVDRDVKDLLSIFNPEFINVGDRFDNNLAIVDKYLELKPTKQVIISNGEFIEDSIMSSENPVIFIGRNNVPDSIREYITKSDFEVAVLVGNELVAPATFIKRQLGISVFVKFAQGSRSPTGGVAQVEDLDKFLMPSYAVELGIADIMYNIATKQIEVTYQNKKNLAVYFKSTITIKIGGEEFVIGDEEPVFLDGGEFKTIGYPIEAETIEEETMASVYVLFGEAPKSLEYAYQAEKEISIIDVLDESKIEIKSVVYDKMRKRFEITVENLKEIDTYANAEIIDLLVNDEYKTYASEKIVHLGPYKKQKLYVRTNDFLDMDYENNNFINVDAYYGQRENSLINVFKGEYEFLIARGELLIYILVIVLIAILAASFILRKKCPKCKYNNPFMYKRCKKCGTRL